MMLLLIRKTSKPFVLLALLGWLGFVSSSNAQPSIKGLKFEVLSVRPMTDKEYRDMGDNIGPDLVVRFRLSNEDRKPLYYLAIDETILPVGNLVSGSEKKYEWIKFPEVDLLQKSPGIPTSLGRSYWLPLDYGSAVEWKGFAMSEFHGSRHAFTVFIKEGPNGEAKEIPSTFYLVPDRPKK